MSDPGPAENISAQAGHGVARNALFAIVGATVINLCRFLVVALIANYASPDILGHYDYANSVLSAPLVLFLALELRGAFVSDTRAQFSYGAYRTLRTLGMAIATPIVVILSLRSGASGWLLWMGVAVALARVALQFGELEWGIFQRIERLDLMAWSNILRGVTLLAPLVVFFALRNTDNPDANARAVAFATIVTVLAWLAIWWFFDRRESRRRYALNLSWTWTEVARLAANTAPLGLVVLIITLCDAVPRWVIAESGASGDLENLGYFSALRVITLAAGMVVVQVGTASGHRLATYYQADLPAFLRLSAKLVAVSLTIGAGMFVLALFLGEPFLRALYPADYARFSREFLILVAAQAVILLASSFGFITTQMRQFWIQVPAQGAVLAVTTVVAWLLIPANPVSGGAWTALARSVTHTVVYFVCVLVGLHSRDQAVKK